MNSLQKLISSLQNNEQVQRFKQLESIIDHNENIQTDFEELLRLQKIMVQKKYYKTNDLQESQKAYDLQKEKLYSYLIVEEYLDLLDEINNDLKLIQTIFEEELNMQLDY